MREKKQTVTVVKVKKKTNVWNHNIREITGPGKQFQIIYLMLDKQDIFCILSYVLTLIKHN